MSGKYDIGTTPNCRRTGRKQCRRPVTSWTQSKDRAETPILGLRSAPVADHVEETPEPELECAPQELSHTIPDSDYNTGLAHTEDLVLQCPDTLSEAGPGIHDELLLEDSQL